MVFSERRIDDVMKIPKIKAGLKDGVILKKYYLCRYKLFLKKPNFHLQAFLELIQSGFFQILSRNH